MTPPVVPPPVVDAPHARRLRRYFKSAQHQPGGTANTVRVSRAACVAVVAHLERLLSLLSAPEAPR